MMVAPCGSTPNTRQQYNARPMWINTKHKTAVWCSPHVEQHKYKAAVQCSPHVEQHKYKAAVQCSPHVDQHQTQGSSMMLTPCGSTPNTRQQFDAHPMWINTKHKAAVWCSPHVDQHQTQGSSMMLAPCGSTPNTRQQYDARPMWINTKHKAAVLCSPHVDQHQTQGSSMSLAPCGSTQMQGSSTILTPCGSTPNTRQQYESCPMWINTNARQQYNTNSMWINTKHKAAVWCSPHVDQHQTQGSSLSLASCGSTQMQGSSTILTPCGSTPNARQQSIVNLACRHIYPSWVLVQPRKTCPCLTERLLMGRKKSNQIKQTINLACFCCNSLASSKNSKENENVQSLIFEFAAALCKAAANSKIRLWTFSFSLLFFGMPPSDCHTKHRNLLS